MNAPLSEDNRLAQADQYKIPFNSARLDALMEDAHIDAILVTSKHNIQYLLGGYRFFFFEFMDAIGTSRYLPILIYQKRHPDHSAYIGNPMESYEKELDKFWTPVVSTASWGTLDSMALAIDHLQKIGGIRRIGVELAFLPADAAAALSAGMPNCDVVDALVVLERLRARKSEQELQLLKEASNRVIDSMLSVFATSGAGSSKQNLVDALRLEEQKRGLNFDYCLITAGTSLNRAPSCQILKEGDIISLDSGGNFCGYIGDLCRMGIVGQPDAELQQLLGEVDGIQLAARVPIRAGARGGDIFDAAGKVLDRSPHRSYTQFVAHGMGVISHEAPRLTSRGNVPYHGQDTERPLEQGMVISIETTMAHPKRGFIKLEDTVAVTDHGHDAYGDYGRSWNRCLANAGRES
jgi:Xaa-Pro aminopeptidase